MIDALDHNYEDGTCTRCGEADPDSVTPTFTGVVRLAGENRAYTALKAADQLKEIMGGGQFKAVVVANGLNFPDALTGSYLAAKKGAPILLTYSKVQPDVIAYISKNLAADGVVYILGDASAVSATFETSLEDVGITSKRIAGATRYYTNLEILKEAGVDASQPVLIATGTNFADSLSASATGLPILMVGSTLKDYQKEFLEEAGVTKFIILGSDKAVSEKVENALEEMGGEVTRLAGATRYETSVVVAEYFFGTAPEAAVLAYALDFPDGLCGGPLAYNLNAPLLLTNNSRCAVAAEYVQGAETGIVTGAANRIGDEAVRTIYAMTEDDEICVK